MESFDTNNSISHYHILIPHQLITHHHYHNIVLTNFAGCIYIITDHMHSQSDTY